jgi:sec-independent protein translocase protein TatC
VRPLLALAPLLFLAGVAFAYVLVLPPAVRFLQGFNHGAFDAWSRPGLLPLRADHDARPRRHLPAAGGHARARARRPAGLRDAARQAPLRDVALAALAAALPGTDPVTTLLELVPLLALYELSIVMLRMSERRRASVPE